MITLLLFILSLITSLLPCDEHLITLQTEAPTISITVAKMEVSDNTISLSHAQALEAILIHDLTSSNRFIIAKEPPLKVKSTQWQCYDTALDWDAWREVGAQLVLKTHATSHGLQAKLYTVATRTYQESSFFQLKGDLPSDRQAVHKLVDAFVEAIWNEPGIASTRLLYSERAQAQQKTTSSNWHSDIVLCDYDGANAQRITSGKSYAIMPIWVPSPNGGRPSSFCFVTYAWGQPKIAYATCAAGIPARFVTLRGNQMTPAISSDRTKMAFSCDATGRSDLFLVELDPQKGPIEKPRHIYTAKNSANASPTFSPDGLQIAFVSNKDGSPRIYLMDIPAPNSLSSELKPTLLSTRCRENTSPAFSPDGTKIAYAARTTGDRQIWIYELATRQEWQLTTGEGNKENPSWAPDSRHIVFNQDVGSYSQLFIADCVTKATQQITTTPSDKRFPNWEPCRFTQKETVR